MRGTISGERARDASPDRGERDGDPISGEAGLPVSRGSVSVGRAHGGTLPAPLQDLATASPRSPALAMRGPADTTAFASLRKAARVGLISLAVFGVTTTALMANAVISGAVLAMGRLVVDTGPKAVQHPTGGVVAEVLVREGERVEAGDPVIALDAEAARAELLAVETTLAHRRARLMRLVAERDGETALGATPDMRLEALSEGEFRSILANEAFQLRLREEERENRREQIRERIAQARASIEASELQRESAMRRIELLEEELTGLRDLYERRLVPAQRVYDAERLLADAQANSGSLASTIAGERSRISELELQIGQVDEGLRSSITDQIADTRAEVAELIQRRVVAASALRDRTLLAPQQGRVFQLNVRAAGEVIQAGQRVALVVPEDDLLLGEVRIAPADIDQVFPGQEASIVFSAFDRGTTPQLTGTIESVSVDLVVDERSGETYYVARIDVPASELARMGDVELVPGMPVEAFIKTVDRTILSYVTKPLVNHLRRALR